MKNMNRSNRSSIMSDTRHEQLDEGRDWTGHDVSELDDTVPLSSKENDRNLNFNSSGSGHHMSLSRRGVATAVASSTADYALQNNNEDEQGNDVEFGSSPQQSGGGGDNSSRLDDDDDDDDDDNDNDYRAYINKNNLSSSGNKKPTTSASTTTAALKTNTANNAGSTGGFFNFLWPSSSSSNSNNNKTISLSTPPPAVASNNNRSISHSSATATTTGSASPDRLQSQSQSPFGWPRDSRDRDSSGAQQHESSGDLTESAKRRSLMQRNRAYSHSNPLNVNTTAATTAAAPNRLIAPDGAAVIGSDAAADSI